MIDSEGQLAFAQEPGPSRITIRPIFHERNRGKGGAVHTGFAAISGDVVVIQDADLEYDPSDWQPMYDLIEVRKVACESAFKRGSDAILVQQVIHIQSAPINLA